MATIRIVTNKLQIIETSHFKPFTSHGQHIDAPDHVAVSRTGTEKRESDQVRVS